MSKSKQDRAILPADAVLAEVAIGGHVVTAICRMGKTMGRALKLTPIYVRAEDFEKLAALASPQSVHVVQSPASIRNALAAIMPPAAPIIEPDATNVCAVCNVHRSAVDELGCIRKDEAGAKPVGCILGAG